MTVRRDGATREVDVTPANQGGKGLIGIQLSPFELRTIEPGLLQAVQMSVERNIEWSTLIFRTLGQLFSGEASPRQLMGPVGIAQCLRCRRHGLDGAVQRMETIASTSASSTAADRRSAGTSAHSWAARFAWPPRKMSWRVRQLMPLMVTVIYNDLAGIGGSARCPGDRHERLVRHGGVRGCGCAGSP
jgi:hypothetical protein